MGQLKVAKKDILVVNLIAFLLLSFLFLYLQYAYRHHLSPLSLAYFIKSLELFWYIALPIVIASTAIWLNHQYAKILYVACGVIVSFKVIEGLFIEFNKVIVVVLFFYVVIAYFLFQLYQYYLGVSFLNPNYTNQDLYPPLLREIRCSLTNGAGELLSTGVLTNWDEEGCFIKLDQLGLVPGKIVVRLDFEKRSFNLNGEVVAHSINKDGVGVKFYKMEKKLDAFSWAEFVELVDELGFKPERMR